MAKTKRQPRQIQVIEEETPAPAIAVETVKAGRGKRICPACNKIVPSAAKVCPECNAPRPESKAKKPKKTKTPAANEAGKAKPGRKPTKTPAAGLVVVDTFGLQQLLVAARNVGGIEQAARLLQTIIDAK